MKRKDGKLRYNIWRNVVKCPDNIIARHNLYNDESQSTLPFTEGTKCAKQTVISIKSNYHKCGVGMKVYIYQPFLSTHWFYSYFFLLLIRVVNTAYKNLLSMCLQFYDISSKVKKQWHSFYRVS